MCDHVTENVINGAWGKRECHAKFYFLNLMERGQAQVYDIDASGDIMAM
jgi:hypothetical protein